MSFLRPVRHRLALLVASLLLALATLGPAPAAAASLAEARAQGIFGETRNGYVDLVDRNAPADYKALMAQINAARRADFANLAKKNGIPVEAAGKIVAQEIIEKLPAGAYYEGPSGGWVRK